MILTIESHDVLPPQLLLKALAGDDKRPKLEWAVPAARYRDFGIRGRSQARDGGPSPPGPAPICDCTEKKDWWGNEISGDGKDCMADELPGKALGIDGYSTWAWPLKIKPVSGLEAYEARWVDLSGLWGWACPVGVSRVLYDYGLAVAEGNTNLQKFYEENYLYLTLEGGEMIVPEGWVWASGLDGRVWTEEGGYQNLTGQGAEPTKMAAPTEVPANESGCTYGSRFVDETVEDGTKFDPDEVDRVRKTWRFENTGTCGWDEARLVFAEGDRLGAPGSVAVEETAPGEEVEVGVELEVPEEEGEYKGYYELEFPDGTNGTRVWYEIGSTGADEEPVVVPVLTQEPEEPEATPISAIPQRMEPPKMAPQNSGETAAGDGGLGSSWWKWLVGIGGVGGILSLLVSMAGRRDRSVRQVREARSASAQRRGDNDGDGVEVRLEGRESRVRVRATEGTVRVTPTMEVIQTETRLREENERRVSAVVREVEETYQREFSRLKAEFEQNMGTMGDKNSEAARELQRRVDREVRILEKSMRQHVEEVRKKAQSDLEAASRETKRIVERMEQRESRARRAIVEALDLTQRAEEATAAATEYRKNIQTHIDGAATAAARTAAEAVTGSNQTNESSAGEDDLTLLLSFQQGRYLPED